MKKPRKLSKEEFETLEKEEREKYNYVVNEKGYGSDYDRKVQMFYSVSSEDYVDEETAKDIAYRLHKDGFYKPELGR